MLTIKESKYVGRVVGVPAAIPKKALVDWLSKGRPWMTTLKPKVGPKINWESESASSSSPVSVLKGVSSSSDESVGRFRRSRASWSLEEEVASALGDVTGKLYSEASDWVLNLKERT